jgi:hypothetical protein
MMMTKVRGMRKTKRRRRLRMRKQEMKRTRRTMTPTPRDERRGHAEARGYRLHLRRMTHADGDVLLRRARGCTSAFD